MNRSQNENKNSEALHISKSIDKGYAALKKRMALWFTVTSVSGVVSFGLVAVGIALLILGQMPNSISFIEPALEVAAKQQHGLSFEVRTEGGIYAKEMKSLLNGIVPKILGIGMVTVGIFQAFMRQSLANLFVGVAGGMMMLNMPLIFPYILGEAQTYEPAPYSYVKPHFKAAKEAGDWPKASELLKPLLNDSDDIVMLKAQVAYKAGHAAESIRLMKSSQIRTKHQAQAWLIESLYADSPAGADHQLTDASKEYAKRQHSRRAKGMAALRASAPALALTFLAGWIALTLRRNVLIVANAPISIRQPKEGLVNG